MASRNAKWTRDELILALDLYFRHPPSHISQNHPEIIALSRVLNTLPLHETRRETADFRNPNGVYMKLCNFLRLDPAYNGKGLDAGSKLDETVWDEFAQARSRLSDTAHAIVASAGASVQDSPTPPDDEEDAAPEGRILLRTHKVRERNTTLARKKKALVLQQSGVLACTVCGFAFEKQYGPWGDGFIECHHTVPLSQLRPGQVTHLRDLALVCANCHRMLHRGGEVLTIEVLRGRVRQRFE